MHADDLGLWNQLRLGNWSVLEADAGQLKPKVRYRYYIPIRYRVFSPANLSASLKEIDKIELTGLHD